MMYQKKEIHFFHSTLYKCIVVLCTVAAIMLTACSVLQDNGDYNHEVTINLPHVSNGSSRSIDSGDIGRLEQATRKYRVIFQTSGGTTVMREGTGGAFSASFAVGTEISVTVECLNENDEVIVRTGAKTIKVGAGENTLSFNLSKDGTEVVPESAAGRVTYSWGEASKHGNKNGLPSDPKTYKEGDLFTVEDGSGMTWDHATQQSGFAGWSASVAIEPENGVQATNAPTPGQKYKMPRGGVTLTAQWNKKSYTITYDMNAAGSGNTSSITSINQGSVQALEDYTIDSTTPQSVSAGGKNYTFMEWSDGNGNTYAVGRKITNVTGNITLTAQWSDKNVWTVTYEKGSTQANTQDITNWIDSDNAEDGNSVTLPTLQATGYRFDGWRIDGESNNRVGGTSYTPTQNVTATAQWTPIDYTINYNANGGGGSGSTTFNIETTPVSLESGDNYLKPGYSFGGWETTGGQDVSGMNASQLIAQISSGTTLALQAKWTEMTTLYVSDSGNDTIGDGSNAKPFATVQKAIAIVNGLTGTDLTISISGTISVNEEIYFSASGKTITVTGNGTLQRDTSFASGSMISVSQGTVKFNGPTLDGNNVKISEAGAVINISGSGVIVELVSGIIKNGETTNAGGGVRVGAGSTFKMSGGTITENDAEWGGGGVDVSGRFEMTSGTISKNRASGSSADGGGVNLNDQGVFTMENGSITENRCNRVGGGVKNNGSGATFTLNGGSITNNIANTAGGGVYTVDDNTFNGTGGTLSGNTPDQYGGADYTGSATGSWAAKDATIADTFWLLEDMGDFGEYRWQDYDSGNLDVQRPSGTIKVGASLSGFEPVCNASGGYPRQFLGWIETTDDSTAVEDINSAGDYLTTAKENMQAVFNW